MKVEKYIVYLKKIKDKINGQSQKMIQRGKINDTREEIILIE